MRSDRCEFCFHFALWSTLSWGVFWLALLPVASDLRDSIDWYFFMKLHLKSVPNGFNSFLTVGLVNCAAMPLANGLSTVFKSPYKLPILMFNTVVSVYNAVLFLLILHAGRKVIDLFLLSLPIQLTLLLHNFAPVIITTLIISTLCCRWHWYRIGSGYWYGTGTGNLVANRRRLSKTCLAVLTFVLFSVLLGCVWAVVHVGCRACDTSRPLPRKPALAGHRGCSYDAPENTLQAFRRASELPEVALIETDVKMSLDGELFLLHDPGLRRTTDVVSKCPDVDPFTNASLFNYSGGDCPLDRLSVVPSHPPSSSAKWGEGEGEGALGIPRFSEYLEVAVSSDREVSFDLQDTFEEAFVEKLMQQVVESGIDLRKVWWVPDVGKELVLARYPRVRQATKLRETPLHKMAERRIQVFNDDWSQPVETWRDLKAANISLSLFWVNSAVMLDYAWCLGVDSVTTDACYKQQVHSHNQLFEVCRGLREHFFLVGCCVFLVSLLLTILLCHGTASEDTSPVSLNAKSH